MGKIIRPAYPGAFATGLIILMYLIAFFLSYQIYDLPIKEIIKSRSVWVGMLLVATAFLIMVLILWEEFLFPVKAKRVEGGMLFRNHRQKMQIQILIYCLIPAIFCFIFIRYNEVLDLIRFSIIAAICILAPFFGKITSGIKNYNDFLKITDDEIEYKDNEKQGRYKVSTIQSITIITHEKEHFHQIQLLFKSNDTVTIDLHEMELEPYYDFIYKYMAGHYKSMLKEVQVD